MQLSDELQTSPKSALLLYYGTNTAAQLQDPKYGLQIMSDTYIVNDIKAELAGAKVCWHKATGETKVIDLSSAGLTLPHLRNAGHRDHHQHPSRKKNNNTSNSERGKAAM